MSSSKHTGTATAWGKVIPASASSRNAIVRLPHWTGPAVLPEDGKFKPLPGVPSALSALDLVQKEQAVYCTFPDCGRFVTIAQGSKRAAFRHPRGITLGEHDKDPETLDHAESKAILLSWILRTYVVERFDHDTTNLVLTDSNGARVPVRPDAYVELADGARIAIEYQYSAGSGRRIREKTGLYEQAGINVWWIFSGHSPYTLKLRPQFIYRDGRLGYPETELTTTQNEMLEAGIPFVWFDREHQTIATPAGRTSRLITPLQDELWSRKAAADGTRRKGCPLTEEKYWGPLIKGFSKSACLVPSSLSTCGIDTTTGALVTGEMRKWGREDARAEKEVQHLREEARARHRATELHRRERDEKAKRDAQERAARAKEAERNTRREAAEAHRIATDIRAKRATESTMERKTDTGSTVHSLKSASTAAPSQSTLDDTTPLRPNSSKAPSATATHSNPQLRRRKVVRWLLRTLRNALR